jgi:hypothetical protein
MLNYANEACAGFGFFIDKLEERKKIRTIAGMH